MGLLTTTDITKHEVTARDLPYQRAEEDNLDKL